MLRDVLAECGSDDVALLQLIARLVEIVREVVDAQAALFAVAHLPDVLVHGLAEVSLGTYAIQPRSQHYREREIGIRRRIRHTMLDAGAQPPTLGDAQHGRAVAHAPRNVHGRLVTWHESLVG